MFIKERFLNNHLFSRAIPIALSIWILSLTAYYLFNTPWLSFFISGRPDAKQLIADALKFHWVPVFSSRLPYVFYALILNFIAMLIGNRILRWLKVGFDSRINKLVFSIPLGWSVYSIGIFYLGISKLLYKEAVYCFLMLLGTLSILEILRIYNITSPQSPLSTPPFIPPLAKGGTEGGSQGGDKGEVIDNNNSLLRFKIDKSDLIFLPVIIIFIAIQLVISFSPVWTNDALVYHMALPKLYIKHHSLVHVPGFFFSTLPAHTEMLYLLGLITSGETLSKLFSFSISSMFLLSIFSIGNRYFSKEVGYLATFIMMQASPFFSPYFSELWTDTALGLFSLLGVYAFFMWIEERKDSYLYLSIICFASASATKIQGSFFVPLFFVGFFATVKMDKHSLKKLAWCISAVGIIALPWYIRSWWLTGDPVFPFLYRYLGARYWNEYSNERFWEWHSHHGWIGAKSFSDFIEINTNLFFPVFSISSLSPIIVIFLIPALITLWGGKSTFWERVLNHPSNIPLVILPRWKDGKKQVPLNLLCSLLFITFVCYIFYIFVSPQIRYFYVGLASVCIISAYSIKTVWTKYLLPRISIILCIVAFSVLHFLGFYSGIGEGPFFAGLGVLSQRQFLNESPYNYLRESSKVAEWVNKNLPQDSKILSWWSYGYHLDRDYVLVNPTFQGILDFGKINDAPTFLKSIKELGITHLLFCDFDLTSPRGHVREFLNKCVLELLESGKMALIKQIDSCVIYSAVVHPDCFVFDGNTIRFNDESQRKHLVRGWSSTEAWGTWSEGKESVIIVNFTPTLPSPSKGEDIVGGKDYTMLIKATGFSVPGKQQSVKIYLENTLLGEHAFTHPTAYFEDIEIKIPSAYIKEGNQQIRFVYSFTGSPAEHGIGPDVRQLAMGVSSIEFK